MTTPYLAEPIPRLDKSALEDQIVECEYAPRLYFDVSPRKPERAARMQHGGSLARPAPNDDDIHSVLDGEATDIGD
jgi:hypothetical protein